MTPPPKGDGDGAKQFDDYTRHILNRVELAHPPGPRRRPGLTKNDVDEVILVGRARRACPLLSTASRSSWASRRTAG